MINQLDELDALKLFNLKVDAYFENREFICEGKQWVDFCSTNYLSFEFEKSLQAAGAKKVQEWGILTSWSRMEADPILHQNLEQKIARFLGADSVMLSPSVTMTNFSIISGIVGEGTIFCDKMVHTVVYEACRLARDHRAKIVSFLHQDLLDLENKLRQYPIEETKLIAVDGIYSLSTEKAPICEMQKLCAKYNAFLYIDDAHGFGIVGESPSFENPYGIKGNGLIAHLGGDYSRTFYVSSFGKAFCIPLAFTTIPREFKHNMRAFSLQYLFSAPPSPYIIGAAEEVLNLNEIMGEERRLKIRTLVQYFCQKLDQCALRYQNNFFHPVIFVQIGNFDQFVSVAKEFKQQGILAGLRAFPVVPKNSCGFRFALTSNNNFEQIDKAIKVLKQFA